MGAYIIQSWKVQETATPEEPCFVRIECRREGLVSWLLSLFQISPLTTFCVTADSIEFTHGSFQGNQKLVTPLTKVASLYFGQNRPWRATLALCLVLAILVGILLRGVIPAGSIIGAVLGFNIGLVYYFFNQSLTIGFAIDAGDKYGLNFKESVVGGQSIDEQAVKKACALIQRVVIAGKR